jgi:hypothetical protein
VAQTTSDSPDVRPKSIFLFNTVFLLIFKMFSEQKLFCYSRGWVKQYAESKNSEGKEIKIGFSFTTKYGSPPVHDLVTSGTYGTSFGGVFGGKICKVWRRQDGSWRWLLRVIKGHFCSQIPAYFTLKRLVSF